MGQYIDLLAGFGQVKFQQTPGNYGDDLIKQGTEKMLNERGVEYGSIPDPNCIAIHGGGSFNDIWMVGIKEFQRAIWNDNPKHQVPIVIGPQSYRFTTTDPEELLDVDREVHLCAREQRSLDLLRGLDLNENVHVHYSRDAALYLDASDFSHIEPRDEQRPLVAFRNDKESQIASRLKRSVIRHCWLEPCVNDISDDRDLGVEGFVREIKSASTIYTDRLHVTIGAAILGTECVMFPNSFWKNRAMYDDTLHEYDTITFDSRTE